MVGIDVGIGLGTTVGIHVGADVSAVGGVLGSEKKKLKTFQETKKHQPIPLEDAKRQSKTPADPTERH